VPAGQTSATYTVSTAAVGEATRRFLKPDRALGFAERCISPSDFGFHNALRRANGTLAFLDFEYAGWADPAKLVCDFLFQVAVPTPPRLHDVFMDQALRPFEDPDAVRERVAVLTPVYRVKWTCILLNEFVRSGRKRREFARGAATDLRSVQLGKALHMLGLTGRPS
jgi:hypothetical protein